MVSSALKSCLVLLTLLYSADRCVCWDQAELDLFDLVEEIGENFYDVLHVEQVRVCVNKNLALNYSTPTQLGDRSDVGVDMVMNTGMFFTS